MSDLIPVVSGQINGRPTFVVDGRLLHTRLEVGKDFTNWIKDRIHHYGYQEKRDFEVFANFGENPQGGRPAKEFWLTLGMAKELAMLERSDKGRRVRRYFIDCEERLRGPIQEELATLRAQRAVLWAWLIEVRPEVGKIARFRRAGLNRLEIARALGWGEKRVRLAEKKLAEAGLLSTVPQLALTLEG